MTRYEVWSEKDGESFAQFLGEADARSFGEACDKVCHPDSEWRHLYDKSTQMVWGKRLFPSKVEANGFRRCECRVGLDEIVVSLGDRVLIQVGYVENDNGSITVESAVGLGSDLRELVDTLNFERYRT